MGEWLYTKMEMSYKSYWWIFISGYTRICLWNENFNSGGGSCSRHLHCHTVSDHGQSSRSIVTDIISALTHWGRVMHICVSKLTIIGSDNGLSPGRRQAIIWTNAGILLIGTLGTNVSEILIKICTFSLKKMLLKMLSGKRRPSCLGLNVLSSL